TYIVNGQKVPAMLGQAILGTGNGGFNSFSSSAWFFNAQKQISASNGNQVLIAQLEEPDTEEIRDEEQSEQALEWGDPESETIGPEEPSPQEEVIRLHTPEDIEAVRNGACSVDPNLEEAI